MGPTWPQWPHGGPATGSGPEAATGQGKAGKVSTVTGRQGTFPRRPAPLRQCPHRAEAAQKAPASTSYAPADIPLAVATTKQHVHNLRRWNALVRSHRVELGSPVDAEQLQDALK